MGRKKRGKKQKKQDSQNQGAGDDHLDANGKARAILAKGFGYARRGGEYIGSRSGRGVYNTFSHMTDAEPLRVFTEYATFPGGPEPNFSPEKKCGDIKAGQRYPYPWEAHHMLPGSAFYYESNGRKIFTYKQYKLLLQSDYDINHGHNIIMLPRVSWGVPVHALIQHAGDHPTYTGQVMDDLKKISKQIQQLVDENEPHKNMLDLFILRDDLYQALTREGVKGFNVWEADGWDGLYI